MRGLPPILIQVGENEILYDDAIRMRDAGTTADVNVTFESWRHGIHVWPVLISAGLPESASAIEHLATFLKITPYEKRENPVADRWVFHGTEFKIAPAPGDARASSAQSPATGAARR